VRERLGAQPLRNGKQTLGEQPDIEPKMNTARLPFVRG
jgi:hypothetical protein